MISVITIAFNARRAAGRQQGDWPGDPPATPGPARRRPATRGAGSLSASSSDRIHGRRPRRARSDSRAVLPKPAGRPPGRPLRRAGPRRVAQGGRSHRAFYLRVMPRPGRVPGVPARQRQPIGVEMEKYELAVALAWQSSPSLGARPIGGARHAGSRQHRRSAQQASVRVVPVSRDCSPTTGASSQRRPPGMKPGAGRGVQGRQRRAVLVQVSEAWWPPSCR